jgi:hypothetical protein
MINRVQVDAHFTFCIPAINSNSAATKRMFEVEASLTPPIQSPESCIANRCIEDKIMETLDTVYISILV